MSPRTLSVIIDGDTYHVNRPDEDGDTTHWDRVKAALNDPTITDEEMLRLVSPARAVQNALDNITDDVKDVYAAAGLVRLEGGVLYFDDEEVNNTLSERIIDILNEGLDVLPWIKFADNVFKNPAPFSRDELYLFLENANLPITEDGCFLAYKNVRNDYKDINSGTFDNSIGAICEMPREEVDPDRYRTCSAGLHFCSKDYLPHFSHYAGGHTMVVKINPTDVVSIPADYNNSKGRCWRYEVVGEIPTTRAQTHRWKPLVDAEWTAEVTDPQWDEPEGVTVAEIEDVAPTAPEQKKGNRFKKWLRRN
jgi:hypothetical protein